MDASQLMIVCVLWVLAGCGVYFVVALWVCLIDMWFGTNIHQHRIFFGGSTNVQ